MFDAYAVAVEYRLIDKFSGVLGMMTNKLSGAKKNADELHASLKRCGELFKTGALVTGAGVGMLFSLKGPIGQALEWERELARLRQMGLGDVQISDAQKFVKANAIIGTSIQDRMKLFVEAQGAFRESGMAGDLALEAAKTMMPALASYNLAIKTLDGEKRTAAEGSIISLNRLVEQMGGLNDSKRAVAIVDAAFRSVQASGRMISPDQLRQFRAYGGAAVANLSDETIFASLEPIIGELKGSTTGMGLRTASNRLQGLIKPPNQLLSEAERLGIWDSRKYTKNMMGGIKTMKGNPLNADLANLMNTDTLAFTKKLMEIYAAHGINTAGDRSRENTLLFGSNGAKVYDLIMRQMTVLERSVNAFEHSRGIDTTNKDNINGPMMAIEKFHAAISDLGLVIGETVLPALTPMIEKVSELFKGMQQYPELVKGLTIGFAGLAAAMTIGGTLTMATAGFQAVGLGAAALVSPIGLAITALAGLVAVLSYFKPDRKDDGKDHTGQKWVPGRGRGGAGGHWEQEGEKVYDARRHAYATVRPSKANSGTVHTTINIDGKKVAQAVTPYVAAPLRAGISGGAPDLHVALPQPGAFR